MGCLLPDYVGNSAGGAGGASGPGGSGAAGGGGTGGADGGAGVGGGDSCPPAPFATQIGDGNNTVFVQHAAPLAHGGVAVLGSYSGDLPLTIGRDLPAAADGELIFVAVFDRNGAAQWAKSFGGGSFRANGLAATSDGGLALAMSGTGPGTEPTGGTFNSNDNTGLLFVLDSEGSLQWDATIDGLGDQSISAIAVTADDDVVVTGSSRGKLVIAGEPRPAESDQASPFYARFSSGGVAEERILWPVTGSGAGRAVAVHSDGAVYVAGDYDGDFGPSKPELPSEAASRDGFLLEIASDKVVRAMGFGSSDRFDTVAHLTLIDDDLVIEGGTGPDGSAVFLFADTQEAAMTAGLAGRYVGRMPRDATSGATIRYAQSSTGAAFDVTVGNITRSGAKNTLVSLWVQDGAIASVEGQTFAEPTVFVELGPQNTVLSNRALPDDASLSAVWSSCGHFVYGSFKVGLDWYEEALSAPAGASTGVVAFHPNVLLRR